VPGFWRAYFAARAAPLGPVPPQVVTALFFGFHPATVARAVPDVWTRAAPDRIVAARRVGAATALDRLAGPMVDEAVVATAADAVEAAAGRVDTAGRALAAANQGLPVEPAGPPWERLWQGCTTLREHRGDGHVAALVAAGCNGLDGHVLQVATEPVPRDVIFPARGWSDHDWDASTDRLRARGLVGGDGLATAKGRALKDRIEARTDELAAAAFTEAELDGLTARCRPIAAALDAAAYMRFPNPMGLPPTEAPEGTEPGSGL
jgi:hypothetical protein